MYCRDNHVYWDKHINEILFALRTCVHESTGFSPSFLNFGRELRSPYNYNKQLDTTQFIDNRQNYVENLIHNLQVAHRIAGETARKQSIRQAKYYNLRVRKVEYNIGDLVWRSNKALSKAVDNIAQGLTPKFIGPYIIKEKLSSGRYKLCTMGHKESGIWHVSDLRKVI